MVACGLAPGSSPAQEAGLGNQLDVLVNQQIDSLVATYKSLHANPELSGHEENTAAFVANQLRSLGYSVTGGVGKYKQPGLTG
jgi:metal-dependent amidase/aminoacylase/carboxypeptidase family protein